MVKLFAVVLLGSALATASTTFSVNNAVGGGSVSGTIVTDGTIGVLGTSNIIDWNLFLDDGSSTFDLLGPLSGNNSEILLMGPDFSATSSQLLFNFSGSGLVLFQNPTIGSGVNYFCLETDTSCTLSPAGESLNVTSGVNQFTSLSGVQVVGVADTTGAPEPASVGLLALGGAALLGCRKKWANR